MANDANFAYLERLIAFAQSHGHSILELAFAWLAAQPSVSSIIAGATTPEQVTANITAVGWRMTAAELAALPART